MSAVILDTETSGACTSSKVIELAYYQADSLENEKALLDGESFLTYVSYMQRDIVTQRYYTSHPIHPRAFEVHGIYKRDLLGKPPTETITLPPMKYMVGHNITVFDKRLLKQSNPTLSDTLDSILYIDTLKLSKSISKFQKIDFGGHSLDNLTAYYYPEHAEQLVPTIHSAHNDVLKNLMVLIALTSHLPSINTWDDLYELQQTIGKMK
jgi:DNA polymerase III epsilon subunit-like protein